MKEEAAELGAASKKAPVNNGSASVAKQLEALRAERAELARRREQREQRLEALAELEREQRALDDERALDEMVEKYGPVDKAICTVETDAGLIILRRPTSLKFRRFQDKGSFASDDVLAFVRPCVLHPASAAFESILDELPATLTRLANALVTVCGQRTEELGKK